MWHRCPAALWLASSCLIVSTARAADELPPVGRPVHVQTWDGESFLTTPQVEPLAWESRSSQPRWSGRVGAVILERVRPDSTPFVINPVTGANIIDPAGFDLGFAGGVDVGVVRYGRWADLEFRYFGVHDWDAMQGPVFSADGFTIPIPGFDPALFPLNVAGWYSTSLDSVELNLRRNVLPAWSLLAGFRYISFRERMATFVGDAGLANGTVIAFQTVNDLFGLQIGGEGILWRPSDRFRVETALKAAVCANAAQSSVGATARGSGEAGDNGTIWWGRDHTAFIGDLNFVGVYQLSESWALRGGYQLLWLSGVAVASEQIGHLNFATGDVGTDTSGGVFFHGALVGLERTW